MAELRYGIAGENMQSHISIVSYFHGVIDHKANYISHYIISCFCFCYTLYVRHGKNGEWDDRNSTGILA